MTACRSACGGTSSATIPNWSTPQPVTANGANGAPLAGRPHPAVGHAPDDYGGMWTRLTLDIGPADFIAPQDFPCEPDVRKRTGMTACEHAYWTVENYLYLAREFYFLPWIPVPQG